MLTSLIEKANQLVSETKFRQSILFETVDDLKLAAFAGMFVSCFEEFYPEEASGLNRNPTSKRELTNNMDLVLSKLCLKLPGNQLSQVRGKQIMDGNINCIIVVIDAYLELGKLRRLVNLSLTSLR